MVTPSGSGRVTSSPSLRSRGKSVRIKEVTDRIERPGHVGSSGLPRSTDIIHVTDILNYIEEMTGEGYKGDGFTDLSLAGELGFCWEDALEKAFAGRFKNASRPEEMVVDGIAMSPDGWDAKSRTLYEYKLTWKSKFNLQMETKTRWQRQSMAYCYGLGVTKVQFWICHVMAGWGKDGGNIGPELRVFDIRYLRREVKNNWKMLVNNKEDAWEWVKEKQAS